MELKSLRKADFITSIIMLIFGAFITILASRMPMHASYGGVESHWYVAPALFPLFLGIGIMLLSLLLCFIAVRDGGARAFLDGLKHNAEAGLDVKKTRTYIVMFSMGSFIYLFIPYIDFIISITIFLFFICTVFYPESALLMRQITRYFLAGSLVLLILLASGVAAFLNGIYVYTLDFMAVIYLISMIVYAFKLAKKDGTDKKKIQTVLWVAIVTPLILCPLFRYALLTPLPMEGVIIDHMNLVYYAIKY